MISRIIVLSFIGATIACSQVPVNTKNVQPSEPAVQKANGTEVQNGSKGVLDLATKKYSREELNADREASVRIKLQLKDGSIVQDSSSNKLNQIGMSDLPKWLTSCLVGRTSDGTGELSLGFNKNFRGRISELRYVRTSNKSKVLEACLEKSISLKLQEADFRDLKQE